MKLNEWQYMNKPAGNSGSNSSTGYKKRFEKLIKYHIDHASSELESITKKDIKESGFHLGEHYNTGLSEFDRYILVSFIKNTNEFIISIFVDNKEVYSTQVKGYDNCVAILEAYMYLPDKGTQDYDDLLTEWVAMKNNNTSATTTNTSSAKNYPDQTDRYKRLLAQIDSDKTCSYTVNLLDDRILAITINSKKGDLGFKLIFKPYVPCYSLQLTSKEGIKEISREDFDEVLDVLLDVGLINNTDLCESASSIADDFKLYENLWN